MRHDAFSGLHPAVNLLYFVLVLTFSLWFSHPVCQGIALTAAFAYSICLRGASAARLDFLGLIPLVLITALLNPLFSHQGVTILAYLPTGNPLTEESVLYGFSAGAALAAVLCWFFCLNAVFSSDQFVYLFGRVIPSLSLVLSMTLRFVPRFVRQFRRVSQARSALREHPGGTTPGIRDALAILSGVAGWAMENAVETADSMKSRGYGLPGRTAYSLYRFDRRDRLTLLFLALAGAFLAACRATGALDWRYYPSVRGNWTPLSAAACAAYALLCLLPVLLKIAEDRTWKTLKSGT